jgi:hypothetical protein
MTMAALISIVEPMWQWHGQTIHCALWIVVIGATLTALNRARRALVFLNKS